jgi:hypothetical protein
MKKGRMIERTNIRIKKSEIKNKTKEKKRKKEMK